MPLNKLFRELLTEIQRVTSPPALEESPGVRLRPQACFEANRRKAALRPRWRIETPQRSLGTFHRWKVPRRRLLQKRLVRRAGIRFAYLVRTALCQSERGKLKNPRAAEGCGPYSVRLTVTY